MSRVGRVASTAAALGLGAIADLFLLPPAPRDIRGRRPKRIRDKHHQGAITVSANRGRLTKRGKRGYGLVNLFWRNG